MRIAWVAACALAAWSCANWATGIERQRMLAPDYIWLWWLPAFAWTVIAIRTALGARG